jgi:hypothetical protein
MLQHYSTFVSQVVCVAHLLICVQKPPFTCGSNNEQRPAVRIQAMPASYVMLHCIVAIAQNCEWAKKQMHISIKCWNRLCWHTCTYDFNRSASVLSLHSRCHWHVRKKPNGAVPTQRQKVLLFAAAGAAMPCAPHSPYLASWQDDG